MPRRDTTQTSPDIWTRKDGFNARLATFANDSDAAAGTITSEASFDATMPKLLARCGARHTLCRATF